ncbi:MAG TPA: ATP-binding cassette domain-containing protein, partial [Tissierellaceae bacterium]
MDIEINNLNFGYDNLTIFENYNTKILSNRYNAVIGPSGCGKTTLLRILSGLEDKYSGHIKGMENKKISICFQENRLLENYSIRDNINFVQNENLLDSYIKLELEKIGLDIDLNKKVSQLSGGMKRRIAIL